MYSSHRLLNLDLNIFIIVATVPTELQNCAKVLQVHFSWGGGTPCLQPKSHVTFTQDLVSAFKSLAAEFAFKYFHYSGHCAHRVAKLCKSAASASFRG